MSFSSEVKEELAKHIGKSRHCQLAELAALIAFECRVNTADSENPALKEKYQLLVHKLFEDHGSFDAGEERRILKAVKMWDEETGRPHPTDTVHGILLQESRLEESVHPGAFLASGSISDLTSPTILRSYAEVGNRRSSSARSSTASVWTPRS